MQKECRKNISKNLRKLCRDENGKFIKGHKFNIGRSSCGWNKGKKMSEAFREKCKMRMIGNQINKDRKHKNRKGVPSSEQKKRKLSKFNTGRYAGSKNHFWKGGVTPINLRIRMSGKYKKWQRAVFARDNWTCQECNARSKKKKRIYLEAHHIKAFSKYPKLRFKISNGITLCDKCHHAK